MMHSNEATIPEDDVMTDAPLVQDPENPSGLRQRPSSLSEASKKFDVGDKGFLTGSERELRAYDTNSDGNLDVVELKNIVRELKDERREKNLLKKISQGSAGVLLLSFLGNFGLIWAVLALTRQLETKNGNLASASTGEMVGTKGKGNTLRATMTAGALRRLMAVKEKYGSAASLRHVHRSLQEAGIVITATVPDCKRACMRTKYTDYTTGVSLTMTMPIGATTITSTIAAGMAQTLGVGDECDTYTNIRAVGYEDQVYVCECCVETDCEVSLA